MTSETVRDVGVCGTVGSVTATDQGTQVRPSGSGPWVPPDGPKATVLIGASPDQARGERRFEWIGTAMHPDPYHARQVSSPIGGEEIAIDRVADPCEVGGMTNTNIPKVTASPMWANVFAPDEECIAEYRGCGRTFRIHMMYGPESCGSYAVTIEDDNDGECRQIGHSWEWPTVAGVMVYVGQLADMDLALEGDVPDDRAKLDEWDARIPAVLGMIGGW